MTLNSRGVGAVVIAALVLAVVPARAKAPALDLGRLLDDYAAGRFDQALAAVVAAGDIEANQMRAQWRTAGRLWIDAAPAEKARRALVAASFALETEHHRMERGGWSLTMAGVCPPDPKDKDRKGPAGQCVMEWAWSVLVERNQADAAERAWVLAAASLLSGMREYRLLYTTIPGAMIPERGLLADALVRHPGDSQLLLERAMALAARYNITTAAGGVAPDLVTIINMGRAGMPAPARPRIDPKELAITTLRALIDNPEVGPEARLRLGYLLWATGDIEGGRAHLDASAKDAKDRDLQYLAKFLSGWTALQANKIQEAGEALAAALEIRPDSQSAALALAALELRRGEAARADELMKSSLSKKPDDVDPWREFLYGHYPRIKQLIADLRREVAR